MALAIFASIGVDVAVIGGIVFAVFFVLCIASRIAKCIKTYRKHKQEVLPQRNEVLPRRNSTTRTTVTTHQSQVIALEPREPPNKIMKSAAGPSVAASTFKNSEHEGVIDCVVCLYPLREGEMMLRLPACGHFLHDLCVCSWFFANSVCPACGVPVNAQLTVKLGTV